MPRTKLDKLVEELNNDDTVKETVARATEKVTSRPAPEKKKFGQEDLITCKSVITGGLYMEGQKSKQLYVFGDYGGETEIEYRDLVAEVRLNSSFVFEPRFIIEDEDFIEGFPQLKQFYAKYLSAQDIRNILELPTNQMLKRMQELPSSSLDSLRNTAATMVATGAIDSVSKIKALDEFFETDMEFLSSLMQK